MTSKYLAQISDAIKDKPQSEIDSIIRFHTSCCKHCKMADLSCSAYMLCQCHSEQIEHVKSKLKIGEYA